MLMESPVMESPATVYQDADGTFCVVGVKSSNIKVQELWETSDLMLKLGNHCAAMLLRSINKHFREVLSGVNVRDNNIIVKSFSIEIQELWKESELVLTLGYPGAAMLLRSINKHFRRVFPGVNVPKDSNVSSCRMPNEGLATKYQDADPFCVVADGIGNCKRSSRRILGV
jgi:hypothetical protein